MQVAKFVWPKFKNEMATFLANNEKAQNLNFYIIIFFVIFEQKSKLFSLS